MKQIPELRNGYKNPKHLKRVRELPCCACIESKKEQRYKTEAHHLIGCGMGLKASDLKTIPLCTFHHDGRIPGFSIHSTVLKKWEEDFKSQNFFLEQTWKILGTDKALEGLYGSN